MTMPNDEQVYYDRRAFTAEIDADTVTIHACNPRNPSSGIEMCETMRIPREQWDRIVREYQAGEDDTCRD